MTKSSDNHNGTGRSRMSGTLMLAAALVLLAAGVIHIFHMRFAAGDIYPAYSSYKTDPIGTKALYESIAAMPDMQVSRKADDTPLSSIGPSNTLLLAAYEGMFSSFNSDQISVEEIGELKSFFSRSGRLAITLPPAGPATKKLEAWKKDIIEDDDAEDKEDSDDKTKKDDKEDKANKEAGKTEGRKRKDKSESKKEDGKAKKEDKEEQKRSETNLTIKASEWIALTNWLGVAVHYSSNVVTNAFLADKANPGLPAQMPFLSSGSFTNLSKDWKVIYRTEHGPVMIEKLSGNGSIVLCASSYFLSNESLVKDRASGVISWFIGSSRHVIFDEVHLGINNDRGVSYFARKFGLYWLAAGLLAIALLFVWKNSSPLMPPPFDGAVSIEDENIAHGKDSTSALANLLKQNIGDADILAHCLEEWKRNSSCTAGISQELIGRMQKQVQDEINRPAHQRNPAAVYNAITEMLEENRRKYT